MEHAGYRVRESRRARHVRFVVSRLHGLEVVVPVGFDRSRIPDLLQGKREWLARASARFEMDAARTGPEERKALPDTLRLRALPEEWRVVYRATGSSRVTAREHAVSGLPLFTTGRVGCVHENPSGLLVVSGDVGDETACRAALARWLGRKARAHLPPALAATAEEAGIGYSGVSLRAQRTRWGSCSHGGVISLNRALLFLPGHLFAHVLVHELCHTVEMSHSPRFWAMVERCRPGSKAERSELKTARVHVPRWIEVWMDERSANRQS